jgi:cellulose synthase/poly-beta-1,6-N-acetylglucosamine synthase-like glycosyltransferase
MLAQLVVLFLIVPATVAVGYYLLLMLASAWPRRRSEPLAPRTRFTILIPAHNEEAGLPRTLASLAACDYPSEWVQVLVIADNCSDRTAEVARAGGAMVHERCHATDRGKGYALATGMPLALATPADAVLVLDADCRLDAGSLRALDRVFQTGAQAAQGAVISLIGQGSPSELIAAVGSRLENRVQAGWGRLGYPIALRGTGMAFHRELLQRHPWSAFGNAEDAEFSATLQAAGVRIRHAHGAAVRTEAPACTADFLAQRQRWGAALLSGGGRRWEKLFASKPLVLAQLVLTTLAAVLVDAAALAPMVLLLWSATWLIYIVGIVEAGAMRAMLRNSWQIPRMLGALIRVSLRGRRIRGNWVRAARPIPATLPQ